MRLIEEKPATKQRQRVEIEQQVRNFLASGGMIEILHPPAERARLVASSALATEFRKP